MAKTFEEIKQDLIDQLAENGKNIGEHYTESEMDSYVKSKVATAETLPQSTTSRNVPMKSAVSDRNPYQAFMPKMSPAQKIVPREGGDEAGAMGSFAWHLGSSIAAPLSLASYMMGKGPMFTEEAGDWYKKLDKRYRFLKDDWSMRTDLSKGAQVGGALGELAGFLVPLKAIGMGTRGVMSAVKGSRTLARKTARDVANEFGDKVIEGSVIKSAIKKSLSSGPVKLVIKGSRKSNAPGFGMSDDAVMKGKQFFDTQLRAELGEALSGYDPKVVGKIADAVTEGMTGQGRHINSVGAWIESLLGARLNTSARRAVMRYAGRVADMTVDFSIYNIMDEAVRNEGEWSKVSPGANVWNAFKFSLFLPAIEMIPPSGSRSLLGLVKLRKEIKKLPRTFDKAAEKITDDQMIGLVGTLVKDSAFKDFGFGVRSVSKQNPLTAGEAKRYLKKMYGIMGRKTLLRGVTKEYAKDFAKSSGRMGIGAVYFNSHEVMQHGLLGLDNPYYFWTHMLAGAFFTRQHKPVFESKNRNLKDIDKKVQLMEYFNIDGSRIDQIIAAHGAHDELVNALPSLRTDESAKKINEIFDDPKYQQAMETKISKVDDVGDGSNQHPSHTLVELAYRHIYLFSKRTDLSPAERKVKSQYIFDPSRIVNNKSKWMSEISQRLSDVMVKIGKNKDGEWIEEKLSTNNFDKWMRENYNRDTSGFKKLTVNLVERLARELLGEGQFERREPTQDQLDKGEDGTLAISDVANFADAGNLKSLATFLKLVDRLKNDGVIEDKSVTDQIDAMDIMKNEKALETAKELLTDYSRGIQEEYYLDGEAITGFDINENAFLDALSMHKEVEFLDKGYDIVSNNQKNLTESEKNLAVGLKTILENRRGELPSNPDAYDIIPDKGKEEQFKDYKASAQYGVDRRFLRNLARLYGIGRKNKKHINSVPIKYTDARRLIQRAKDSGLLFHRRYSWDSLNHYYWVRKVGKFDISPTVGTLLQQAINNNFGFQRTNSTGQVEIKWPRLIDIREKMRDLGDYDQKTQQKILKQYQDIIDFMEIARGSIFNFEKFIPMEQEFGGYLKFIQDSHILLPEVYDSLVNKDIESIIGPQIRYTNVRARILKYRGDIQDAIAQNKIDGKPMLDQTQINDFVLQNSEILTGEEFKWFFGEVDPDTGKQMRGKGGEWVDKVRTYITQLGQKIVTGNIERDLYIDIEGIPKADFGVVADNLVRQMKSASDATSDWYEALAMGAKVSADKIRTYESLRKTKHFLLNHLTKIGKSIPVNSSIGDIIDAYNRTGDFKYIKDLLGRHMRAMVNTRSQWEWDQDNKSKLDKHKDWLANLWDTEWKVTISSVVDGYGPYNMALLDGDGNFNPIFKENLLRAVGGEQTEFNDAVKQLSDHVNIAIRNKVPSEKGVIPHWNEADLRNMGKDELKDIIRNRNKVFNLSPVIRDPQTGQYKSGDEGYIYISGSKNDLVEKLLRSSEYFTPEINDAIEKFRQEQLPAIVAQLTTARVVPSIRVHMDGDRTQLLIGSKNIGNGRRYKFFQKGLERGVRYYDFLDTGIIAGRKVQSLDLIENISEIVQRRGITFGVDMLTDLSKQIRKGQIEAEGFNFTAEGYPERPDGIIDVVVGQSSRIGIAREDVRPLENGKPSPFIDMFKEWFDKTNKRLQEDFDTARAADKEVASNVLRRHNTLFSRIAESKTLLDDSYIRTAVRAMYMWDTAPGLYKKTIETFASTADMIKREMEWYKYQHITDGTGLWSKIDDMYLLGMRDYVSNVQHFAGKRTQRESIDKILERGGVNVVGIGDEVQAAWTNAQKRVVESYQDKIDVLTQALPQRNQNSELIADYNNMIKEVNDPEGRFRSLHDLSLADGQSWIGTDMYNIGLIPKGVLPGTGYSGWKPTGHFSDPEAGVSAIMKSNFVYDRYIADILDNAGIDILTTGSSLKEISSAQLLGLPAGDFRKDGKLSLTEALRGTVEQFFTTQLIPGQIKQDYHLKKYTTLFNLDDLDFGPVGGKSHRSINTHVLFNHLGRDAATQLIQHGGFAERISAVKKAVEQLKGVGRFGVARAYFDRSNPTHGPDILEDTNMGMTRYLIERGLDPRGSGLISDNVNRRVKQILIDSLPRIENENSLMSILVPDPSLTMPIYKDVDGKYTQTILGGIKAPTAAKYLRVQDVDKLTFVTRYEPVRTGQGGSRDIVITRNLDTKEWELLDPTTKDYVYDGNKAWGKFALREVERIMKDFDKDFKKRGVMPTYGKVYYSLVRAERNNPDKLKDFSIVSQDVRIPSTHKSDLVLNRLEGFHDSRSGNVASVNMFELATKHQGDFDVDKLFMYFNLPNRVVADIYKRSGDVPDVYAYPTNFSDIDTWENNNRKDAEAGDSMKNDGAQQQKRAVTKLKMSFGTLMRAISAGTFLSNSLGGIIVNKKEAKINGLTEPKKNVKASQKWGNTAQGLVDALKSQNNMMVDENFNVIKYVLFGKGVAGKPAYDAKETGLYREDAGMTENFIHFGKIEKEYHEVLQDGVMELFYQIGSMDTIFSDVYPSGIKRKPEYFELQKTYKRVLSMLTDPNQYIFFKLRRKYIRQTRSSDPNIQQKGHSSLASLQNMFGLNKITDTYISKKEFVDDVAKGNINPSQLAKVFSFNAPPEELLKTSPAGYLLHEIARKDIFRDALPYKGKHSTFYVNLADQITQRIEFLKIFDETDQAGANNMSDVDKMFLVTKKGDLILHRLLPDGGDIKIDLKNKQKMALLRHSLNYNRKGLQRYIRQMDNYKYPMKNNLADARENLDNVRAALEWFDLKETYANKATIKTSRINTYDLRRKKDDEGRMLKNTDKYNNWHIYIDKGTSDNPKFVSHRNSVLYKGKSMYLAPGQKYEVLQNPIRWSDLKLDQVKDGWAMLRAIEGDTGGHIPEMWSDKLPTEQDVTGFYASFDFLKDSIYGNFRRTYEESKFDPQEKHMKRLNLDQEAALINEFFIKWTKGKSGADKIERVEDLIRTMLSPDPQAGQITFAGDVVLPTFKINKRLTRAVIYWSRIAGHNDIIDPLLESYGRKLAASEDNVLFEPQELYKSGIYRTMDRPIDDVRPFALDAFFGFENLYHPIISEMYRRKKGRMRVSRVRGLDNDMINIIHFGKNSQLQTPIDQVNNPQASDWRAEHSDSGEFGVKKNNKKQEVDCFP